MTREEAAEVLELLYGDCDPIEENTWLALRMGVAALRGPQPDCGGKMRIDIPPGNDSVRASTGFQRDGGDKTERRCMANQCVSCGAEMPEGDQVCGYCRRQHGY